MYLLDAKKKVEREFAIEQAKFAAVKRKEEKKAMHKEAIEALKRSEEKEAARRADVKEAARRKEEQDLKEAMERSMADQSRMEKKARDTERESQRAAAAAAVAAKPKASFRKHAASSAAAAAATVTPEGKAAAVAEWRDVHVRCAYVGTFQVSEKQAVDPEVIKKGIQALKDHATAARPAIMIICLEGLKVIDRETDKVAMAHALSRIVLSEFDRQLPLCGFVARNPQSSAIFCHVFAMEKQRHAEQVHGLITKAFRLAFSHEATLKRKKDSLDAPPPYEAEAPPSPSPSVGKSKSVDPMPLGMGAGEPAGPAAATWAKHNPLEGKGARHPTPATLSPAAHQPPVTGPGKVAAPVHAKPVLSAVIAAVPGTPGSPKMARGVASHVSPSHSAPSSPKVAHAVPSHVGGGLASPSHSAPGHDSDEEDDSAELATAAWYQAELPREDAMDLLQRSDDGAFIVRDSQSQPGNFALTMKASGSMHHFIIRVHTDGYCLGSPEQEQAAFPDLTSLIGYYSKQKGCLPKPLNLASLNTTYQPTDKKGAGPAVESFVDPEYQSLRELTEILMGAGRGH